MLLSSRLKLLVAIWVLAECLVFVGVVQLVGFGGALLAGLASTLLGASLLRRAGAATMTRLRGMVRGRQDGGLDEVLESTLAAVAAAALILPGFLSDAAGALLAIPAIRGRAARWMRRGGLGTRFKARDPRAASDTIDLDRGEWTRTPSRDADRLR